MDGNTALTVPDQPARRFLRERVVRVDITRDDEQAGSTITNAAISLTTEDVLIQVSPQLLKKYGAKRVRLAVVSDDEERLHLAAEIEMPQA